MEQKTEAGQPLQTAPGTVGVVKAVCTSEKKGTQKASVGSALFVKDWGIEGDAHAGKWHRQVSLLSYEKIEEFKARGAEVTDGAFGENLVVSGINFKELPIGTRFSCGDVLLELTQIGKQCHSGCAIFKAMGECIMPHEGVFTRVLHGGTIKTGDLMTVLPPAGPVEEIEENEKEENTGEGKKDV